MSGSLQTAFTHGVGSWTGWVRPTSWGIWVFSASSSSWIFWHCFGLWGVVWQHGMCLAWLHLVTVICWEVLSMRFQIFQAGCLLFAFCYVWRSPDCVYPRCGKLNRMGHPVSCVPAWCVIPVQGSLSPRIWSQKVLIRWTDTSDPAITVWYFFSRSREAKGLRVFPAPSVLIYPKTPECYFVLGSLVFGDLNPLGPSFWTQIRGMWGFIGKEPVVL